MARNPFDPFDGYQDLLDPAGAVQRAVDELSGRAATKEIEAQTLATRSLEQSRVPDTILDIARTMRRIDEITQAGKRTFEIDLNRSRLRRDQITTTVASSGTSAAAEEKPTDEEEHLSEPAQPIIQRLQQVQYLPVADLLKVLKNPQLMRQLHHRNFEKLIAELLNGLGYRNVLLTPSSADGGIDVFATKEINGIPIILGCECKQHREDRKVGLGTVRSLLGAIRQSETQATIGVLVTTSTFTKGARKLIGTEATLGGKDFFGVVDWIKEYSKKTG